MKKAFGIILLSLLLLTACAPKEKTIELSFDPNDVRYVEMQNDVHAQYQASFDLSEDGSEDIIKWLSGLPGTYEYSKKLDYSKTSGGSPLVCKLYDEDGNIITEFRIENDYLVLIDPTKQLRYLYYKDGADLKIIYEWLGIIYY